MPWSMNTSLMPLRFSPLTRRVNALQCRIPYMVNKLFKEISPNKKDEKAESCPEPSKQPEPQRDRSSPEAMYFVLAVYV